MFSGTEKTMRLLNGQGAMKILYVRVAPVIFFKNVLNCYFFVASHLLTICLDSRNLFIYYYLLSRLNYIFFLIINIDSFSSLI